MRIAAVVAVLLFSFSMSAAEAQQVSEPVAVANFAWHQLSPATFRCVSTQLAQQSLSIRYLVEQAILPSDSRVESLVSQCSESTAENGQGTVRQRRSAIGNYFPDNSTRSPNVLAPVPTEPTAPPSLVSPGSVASQPSDNELQTERSARVQQQQQEVERQRQAQVVNQPQNTTTTTTAPPPPANSTIATWMSILLLGVAAIAFWIFRLNKQVALQVAGGANVTLQDVAIKSLHSAVPRSAADWSSIVMLFAFVASAPLAFGAIATPNTLVRAIGILIIPASFIGWIVTTVRGLHAVDLYFWRMSSTYVALSLCAGALLIFMLGSLFGLSTVNSHDDAAANAGASATFAAMGLIYLIAAVWCAWLNWKKTSNISLTVSVTVLQLFTGSAIIAVIGYLLFGRSGEENRIR
ncbi:Uncharacterised protein [Afipia felis]|uniref:Uncharacterized protein n=3 Tax=Afipia felis TaxID=1035 RepID=A0A380W3G1_AFIFE|nr:hypothetical protein HMPREF9697_02786 [Afipia felis ATCC 53690]SUU75003.1 Uncharacterised protein [Afipia felis]SUU83069.1 Uncharacterised protein [Afipia felis]